MARSDVSICNRALDKLGADSITSLTDDNDRARRMNRAYEPVRQAELRRRRWKFSIKRTSLAALSDEPDSDFSYQYQLPNDYLRLLPGGDLYASEDLSDYRSGPNAEYQVENGKILTNREAPLSIRYIADITDASLFDSAFAEALSARLAYENCEAITGSSSKQEQCRGDYLMAVREAARASAIESAPEYTSDSEWIMARLE